MIPARGMAADLESLSEPWQTKFWEPPGPMRHLMVAIAPIAGASHGRRGAFA
jgi:hypothetical protein